MFIDLAHSYIMPLYYVHYSFLCLFKQIQQFNFKNKVQSVFLSPLLNIVSKTQFRLDIRHNEDKYLYRWTFWDPS